MNLSQAFQDFIRHRLIRTYGLAIFGALLIALVIRSFFFEAYRIPNGVMEPTLKPGDIIFVSKVSYGLRFPGSETPFLGESKPRYADVVIFVPKNRPHLSFIKRVVGLPGDRVEVKAGHLIFNGTQVPFESSGEEKDCGIERHPKGEYEICITSPVIADIPEVIVPEHSMFVLADNRNFDASRIGGGLMPQSALRAQAKWVWLSLHPDAEKSSFFPVFRFERLFHSID